MNKFKKIKRVKIDLNFWGHGPKKLEKVLSGLEPELEDSESSVIAITL